MSEIADLEGRVGTLETKVKNQGEDIASLQAELDAMELTIVKFFALSPNSIYLNPTANEIMNPIQDQITTRIYLNAMPIVGISEAPGVAPILSNHQIKRMPDLPLTILSQPIAFYAASASAENYVDCMSTVEIQQITSNITLYKHTADFGDHGTIVFKFVHIAESATMEDYERANDENDESFLRFWYEDDEDTYCFVYEGLYYIDAHTADYYLYALDANEGNGEVLTPNIFMYFAESPVTIPARGLTQAKMENYINETILGGKW